MTVVDLRMLCHGDVIITLLTRRALFPKRKLKGKSPKCHAQERCTACINTRGQRNRLGWHTAPRGGPATARAEARKYSTFKWGQRRGKILPKTQKKTLKNRGPLSLIYFPRSRGFPTTPKLAARAAPPPAAPADLQGTAHSRHSPPSPTPGWRPALTQGRAQCHARVAFARAPRRAPLPAARLLPPRGRPEAACWARPPRQGRAARPAFPQPRAYRVPTVRPPSGRSLTRPGAAPSDAQPQHVGSGSEGDGGGAARLGAVTARFPLRPAAAAAHQGSARPGFSSQWGPRPARRVRPAVSGSHSRTRIAIRSGTAWGRHLSEQPSAGGSPLEGLRWNCTTATREINLPFFLHFPAPILPKLLTFYSYL